MSARTQKIGSVIQRTLAPHLIPFEEEHGLITISEVQVFKDISEAKVYICATRSSKRLIEKLNSQSGRLKKEIFKSLTQKRTPRLVFHLDTGNLASKHIERLLEK